MFVDTTISMESHEIFWWYVTRIVHWRVVYTFRKSKTISVEADDFVVHRIHQEPLTLSRALRAFEIHDRVCIFDDFRDSI